MELSFTQQDGKWVAEATVNNDYNLHIERSGGGYFNIYQSSVSGGSMVLCPIPAPVQSPGTVLDWTFSHGYYPMNVRFVSDTKVTSGQLNEVEA